MTNLFAIPSELESMIHPFDGTEPRLYAIDMYVEIYWALQNQITNRINNNIVGITDKLDLTIQRKNGLCFDLELNLQCD